MLDGKKVAAVMPAYNAARTLERTLGEINRNVVDEIIVVDDASGDDTVAVARRLGLSRSRARSQSRLRRQSEDVLLGSARYRR